MKRDYILMGVVIVCVVVLLLISHPINLVNQGKAEAQYDLGVCYSNGYGVKTDYKEALKWYKKAAEQEHLDALFNVGACYYNGVGVKQDIKEAKKWFKKAADKGDQEAMNLLKRI